MVRIYHKVINKKLHYRGPIYDIDKRIEAIHSLRAASQEETLELKLQSIRKLPKFVLDNGIRYKRHYRIKTAEVWYEEIQ